MMSTGWVLNGTGRNDDHGDASFFGSMRMVKFF